jgi:hypothetical protein
MCCVTVMVQVYIHLAKHYVFRDINKTVVISDLALSRMIFCMCQCDIHQTYFGEVSYLVFLQKCSDIPVLVKIRKKYQTLYMKICSGYDLLPVLVLVVKRHCVFYYLHAEAKDTIECRASTMHDR